MVVLLGLAGLAGVIVCLILLIVKLFKKQPKRNVGIAMAVCFVCFVVAIAITPASDGTGEPSQAGDDAQPVVDAQSSDEKPGGFLDGFKEGLEAAQAEQNDDETASPAESSVEVSQPTSIAQDEDSHIADTSPSEKSASQDGEKYTQAFRDACSAIHLDTELISRWEQIDDWANGERFHFIYKRHRFEMYVNSDETISSIHSDIRFRRRRESEVCVSSIRRNDCGG